MGGNVTAKDLLENKACWGPVPRNLTKTNLKLSLCGILYSVVAMVLSIGSTPLCSLGTCAHT